MFIGSWYLVYCAMFCLQLERCEKLCMLLIFLRVIHGLVMICYVFVITSLSYCLKKTRQKIMYNLCGLQYVWKRSLFLSRCKIQISVLFKDTALVSKIYQHCIFLPASVPHWKSMTPGRDVHSFNYIPSFFFFFCLHWSNIRSSRTEHWSTLTGSSANSFLQKALFYFKMYLYYKTTDERGNFRSVQK